MTRISDRLFRIMESQARIDAALRSAEQHGARQPDRVAQLRLMKQRAALLLRNALARRSGVTV